MRPIWRIRAYHVRWLVYLAIVLGIAAWKYLPRSWKPTVTVETPHYIITSSANREQAEEIGRVVEALYNAYSNRFGVLPSFRHEHSKLKLLLYKDRKEFRWVNPGLGWAEAFYSEPYCRAYYSVGEINPYHWMLHEAVHQLNHEVARLHLARWLEEGVAEYFSTSRIHGNRLEPGRIDPNTYPLWWMDEIATAANLKTNLANGSVIPLRTIINGHGGPNINRAVNLYYLHWWTLTHFIFENAKYRESALALLRGGGGIEAFEQSIGPVDLVEPEWHEHVRRIKAAMAGHDPVFLKTGELPPGPAPAQ
jgi:hypothetical protein